MTRWGPARRPLAARGAGAASGGKRGKASASQPPAGEGAAATGEGAGGGAGRLAGRGARSSPQRGFLAEWEEALPALSKAQRSS